MIPGFFARAKEASNFTSTVIDTRFRAEMTSMIRKEFFNSDDFKNHNELDKQLSSGLNFSLMARISDIDPKLHTAVTGILSEYKGYLDSQSYELGDIVNDKKEFRKFLLKTADLTLDTKNKLVALEVDPDIAKKMLGTVIRMVGNDIGALRTQSKILLTKAIRGQRTLIVPDDTFTKEERYTARIAKEKTNQQVEETIIG